MSHTESAMLELLEARLAHYSLPQPLYNEPAYYDIEEKLFFSRRWLLAGFECQIREPGQYFLMELGRNSVIVSRAENGDVRAFYNACRHRGSRICDEAEGRVKRFVCPYHQWSYRLDGTLVVAPNMHEGFDRANITLRAVSVETLGGTIWISLAKEPPSFEDHKKSVLPMLRSHNLANAKVAHVTSVLVNANWKVIDENSRECYHCPTGHPELLKTFKNDFSRAKPAENPAIAALWEKCREAGLDAGLISGPDFRVSRIPFNAGILSTTYDGSTAVLRPLADLPFADVGQLRWHHYPSMFAHVYNDYAMFYRMLPAGPRTTLVTATWLVHRDAQEGKDYDLANLVRVWDATNEQDVVLSERNQRGIDTDGYEPGPYNQVLESDVMKFVDWYAATMREELITATGTINRTSSGAFHTETVQRDA